MFNHIIDILDVGITAEWKRCFLHYNYIPSFILTALQCEFNLNNLFKKKTNLIKTKEFGFINT